MRPCRGTCPELLRGRNEFNESFRHEHYYEGARTVLTGRGDAEKKTGGNIIEKLPLENNFEEPLKSFIDIAVGLIIDGQPPETASLILDAEYDVILNTGAVSVKTAMSLRLIKTIIVICCLQIICGVMKFLSMLPRRFIRIFQKR